MFDVKGAIRPESTCFHVKLGSYTIAILDAINLCEGNKLHITRISVPPSHRGQGVGSLLLEKLKEEAKKADIVELTVAPGGYDPNDQPARIRFYERHGFKKEPHEFLWVCSLLT